MLPQALETIFEMYLRKWIMKNNKKKNKLSNLQFPHFFLFGSLLFLNSIILFYFIHFKKFKML
jgi:hypothetical protein